MQECLVQTLLSTTVHGQGRKERRFQENRRQLLQTVAIMIGGWIKSQNGDEKEAEDNTGGRHLNRKPDAQVPACQVAASRQHQLLITCQLPHIRIFSISGILVPKNL